jgi:hypothetical protein
MTKEEKVTQLLEYASERIGLVPHADGDRYVGCVRDALHYIAQAKWILNLEDE